MDPENGSDQPTTEEPSVVETTTTPPTVDESGESTSSQQTETTPAGRVQEVLDAFNAELSKPQDTPAKPPAEQPEETTRDPQTGQFQPNLQRRNFEGLDDTETRIFKKMSNEAYNHLFPIYQEWKGQKAELDKMRTELSGLQGRSYYDHENAYQLEPAYGEMTGAVQRLNQEEVYWQSQLEAVEAGQPWFDLVFNPETKQYTQTAAIDPSPQAKAALISKISKCQNLAANVQNEVIRFQSEFKNNHQNYISGLTQTREKVLEGVSPALRKSLEKAAETKLNLWPSHVRNRPEVKIAAELLVINEGLTKLLTQKEGELSGRNISNQTQRRAGPANVSSGGPGTSNTVGAIQEQFHSAGYRH